MKPEKLSPYFLRLISGNQSCLFFHDNSNSFILQVNYQKCSVRYRKEMPSLVSPVPLICVYGRAGLYWETPSNSWRSPPSQCPPCYHPPDSATHLSLTWELKKRMNKFSSKHYVSEHIFKTQCARKHALALSGQCCSVTCMCIFTPCKNKHLVVWGV